MKVTDIYIKQCEMAEEVQNNWQPVEGDRFIYRNDLKQKIIIYRKESDEPAINVLCKIMFYLPTLEQLFEMVFKVDIKHRVQMHYGINEADEEGYQIQVDQIDPQDHNYEEEYFTKSIQEGLLQHIYMAEYHKIWTGKKWQVKS